MGSAKRGRKIRSGRKMVRRAVEFQRKIFSFFHNGILEEIAKKYRPVADFPSGGIVGDNNTELV
jgi:hypothetical protein